MASADGAGANEPSPIGCVDFDQDLRSPMHTRSWIAVLLLLTGSALLLESLGRTHDVEPAAQTAARLLPGVQPDGYIQLPNQWRLRPAGSQVELGDFPVAIAVHPDGDFLAVLHSGYREHEITIVDVRGPRPRVMSRVALEQTFYGIAFSPDGRKLFASGGEYEVVHAFSFRVGYLSNHAKIPIVDEKAKFVVCGVAVSPDSRTLVACGAFGNAVAVVPLEDPASKSVISLAPLNKQLVTERTGPAFRENERGEPIPDTSDDCFPYGVLIEPKSRRAFVSLWNKAAVAVLDLAERKIVATWPTEKHPTEMALRGDGSALYISCANSTKVSVLNPENGKSLQTLSCALYPTAPSGNTPNSLSLTPDGQLLFVANADANNVAVFNVADRDDAKPLGFIPVGWYPTAVRYNPATRMLHVANGKGASAKANRHGPQPRPGQTSTQEYIAGLFRGTLSTVGLPTPEHMARYSRVAYACSPLRSDSNPVLAPAPGNPIPAKVGDRSPIKYAIYIVKENRTYDQVFGDIKEGNGSAELCIFPEEITPNHHAIAREFVLLDNTYVEGEVSADGHEWSMGAYATDFVEKTWPLSYRSPNLKKIGYPAEGNYDSVARPAGGYIWDRCAEAGVSYRSYGEWIANGKTPDDPRRATVKALEGHFDPGFHSYDLDYTDQKRADRFISELKRFERDGDMPRLQIVRLPNDHTYGTRAGKPTPTAMVADNDLALGRVIEAITESKFWKETAVFVIEDDAQNGPDHVDAHRVVALVVSPYCKRGAVDSTMYSTSSMLRTMGLILGFQPMSQFDAAARPMYNSFQATQDLRPYKHRIPKADLNAKNTAVAWGADISEKFNLATEDRADDLLFNEVIWRSVKGPNSPMPAPVRAAWFFPH
jgi:DNA-binding beta-propeller fold protein YncE